MRFVQVSVYQSFTIALNSHARRSLSRYIPTRFILRPGCLVIIGTGRLHCFRKMTADELPETDAHYELRRNLIASDRFDGKTLCVSIAYDWYVGFLFRCSSAIDPYFSRKSLLIY